MQHNGLDRRTFLKGAGITAIGAAAMGALTGCGNGYTVPAGEEPVNASAGQVPGTPSWLGQAPEVAERDITETIDTEVLVVGCRTAGPVSYTHLDVYKRQVLASSPAFAEGGEYTLVIGGEVANVNADGYTDSSTVSGGSETAITASCTASAGMGVGGANKAGGMGSPAAAGGKDA